MQIGYRDPLGKKRREQGAGNRPADVYPNRSRRGKHNKKETKWRINSNSRPVSCPAEQTYHFGAGTAPDAGPQYLSTVTWNGEAGTPPSEKLNHDQLLACDERRGYGRQ